MKSITRIFIGLCLIFVALDLRADVAADHITDAIKFGDSITKKRNYNLYGDPADRKAFEAALTKFKSDIKSSTSEQQRLASIKEYNAALFRLEVATQNQVQKNTFINPRRSLIADMKSHEVVLDKAQAATETKIAQSATTPASTTQTAKIEDDPSAVAMVPATEKMPFKSSNFKAESGPADGKSKAKADEASVAKLPNGSVPASATDAAESDAAAQKFKKTQDEVTARCFFAGYRGFDKGGKCKPASDDPESLKKQSGEFAKEDLSNMKCGSGMLACNPTLYGMNSGKKGPSAICVPRDANATSNCEKSSPLKPTCTDSQRADDKKRCDKIDQAQKDYLAVITKEKANLAFLELRRSLAMSCGARQATATAETKAAKARIDKYDFERTCGLLQPRFTFLGELIKPSTAISKEDRDSGAASGASGTR